MASNWAQPDGVFVGRAAGISVAARHCRDPGRRRHDGERRCWCCPARWPAASRGLPEEDVAGGDHAAALPSASLSISSAPSGRPRPRTRPSTSRGPAGLNHRRPVQPDRSRASATRRGSAANPSVSPASHPDIADAVASFVSSRLGIVGALAGSRRADGGPAPVAGRSVSLRRGTRLIPIPTASQGRRSHAPRTRPAHPRPSAPPASHHWAI